MKRSNSYRRAAGVVAAVQYTLCSMLGIIGAAILPRMEDRLGSTLVILTGMLILWTAGYYFERQAKR